MAMIGNRVRVVVMVALCIAAPATAPTALPAQSPDDPRKAYDSYLVALKAAVLKGDADAVAALVTEDRTSVGASGHVTHGRAEQLQQDREAFRNNTVKSFDVQVTEFRSSGALAYAAGINTHVVADKATGKEKTDKIQFVEIMIRKPDGRWYSQYYMNAPVANPR